MRNHFRGVVCGLALGLVAGALPLRAAAPLPAQQFKAVLAQEPQRAAQALAFARSSLPGLQAGATLQVGRTFTNPQGRTVVRLDQAFGGARVYGASSIVHVEADGRMRTASSRLLGTPAPTGTVKLTAAQAADLAVRHLKLRGNHPAPRVERVVFPAALQGGLRPAWDPATRSLVVDKEYSLLGAPLADPAVWAYQVDVAAWNKEDGVQDMQLVVDAATGAILRKQSNLKSEAVRGTGKGQYSGEVALDTFQAPDGTFSLQDPTRGILPNPYFQNYEGLTRSGLWIMYEAHDGGDPHDLKTWGKNYDYAGKAANAWGDGLPFKDYPNEGQVNGETAAVDAQVGLTLAWDMYRNVFKREGIDGQGTTPFAQVHIRDSATGLKYDNAFWSSSLFGMFFGDGTYFADTALKDSKGNPIPGNPSGMMSLTELDITAHELSHGVTDATAGLAYSGESGGLNESASDIMGCLAEAYFTRTPGADEVIPDTGSDWVIGAKCSPGGPLRYMKKPSLDQLSADAWYEGIQWMDVHFNSGPMNRCFYYLAQGAPASASDDAHSPYLPGGMAGIGNHKAAQIWFKALSEYMDSQTNYHEAAAHLVSAATDLYGAGSAEVKAVKHAFTAINVQVEGEPLLTRVTIPQFQSGGFIHEGSLLSHMQILPMGETVTLGAEVKNNPDTRLDWKVGGHMGALNIPGSTPPAGVGVVNPDGTWTAPMRMGWFVMTAVSKAEPDQFAEGLVSLLNLDADADAEQDAVDMGSSALSYYMPYNLKASHSPYGGPWVEDMDVQFFQMAIKAAWTGK